jgi:two-component system response regulator (stage 0 sporulation protein F)
MALSLHFTKEEVDVINRAAHSREDPEPFTSVLVVEDEAVARRALDKLLKRAGYQTTSVESGEEAIRFLDEHEGPQVALIDLDLPGMDGAELIRHLRNLSPDTHAVIMTASSAERVRALVHDHHVPHLRKPLDFRILLNVLCRETRAC